MSQGFHGDQSWGVSGISLYHHDYTVGWICALPCEVAAAEAMLDAVHRALPNPPNDKNVYCLGSISGHNVAITTLPLGIPGTTAATAVAIRMLSTFRSISIPLLVGVGGGVPKDDIRLGDVVVGVPLAGHNAIVQYDFGKTLSSGTIQRIGNLNKPKEQLLAAAAMVRASHQAAPSKMPEFIERALQNKHLLKNGYGYPGPENDILVTGACEHVSETQECHMCEPWVIVRKPRLDGNPRIHYGPIGSGNQVVKNREVRDRLAKTLGNLCFEMEAAGIMDCFPALVIRGICDYCDSYKTKDFQPYAALAAAAFAKELLESLPHETKPALFKTVIEPQMEIVVEKLNFDEARSRLLTIRDPHPETLRWILNHKIYRTWLDDSQFASHRGLLWIKAKPGAGKSTLMKYLLSRADATTITISFFFIARGTEMQRTTLGMYRSLLYQLVKHVPELAYSLDLLTLTGQLGHLEVLRSLFKTAVELMQKPLTCYIDALDESSEDEIRELLEDLEAIMENIPLGCFRVCCASRYYPYISVQAGLDLHLDNEDGHTTDIVNYVNAKLRIGGSGETAKIKAEIVHKASGIFLWVVLVVQILRREYDRGRIHAMRKKLNETPPELNNLFREILLRDNENLQDLVACLQWVLYSERPLEVAEFYHGVLCMDDQYFLTPINVTNQDMLRFITSSSKGLLEPTQSRRPKVQLIHESVKEYLLEGPLTELWPGFASLAVGPSHAAIVNCCERYLSFVYIDFSHAAHMTFRRTDYGPTHPETPIPMDLLHGLSIENAGVTLGMPLTIYARTMILRHAEVCEMYGIPQFELLKTLSTSARSKNTRTLMLKTVSALVQSIQTEIPGHLEADLMLKLVQTCLPLLLNRYLSAGLDSRISVKSREVGILHGLREGFTEILKILLRPIPNALIDIDQYSGSLERIRTMSRARHAKRGFGPFLSLLALYSDTNFITYLLEDKVWAYYQDPGWLNQLTIIYIRRKLGYGEWNSYDDFDGEVDCSRPYVRQLLHIAAMVGDVPIFDKLLEIGLDPTAKDDKGMTAMHYTAIHGHVEILLKLMRLADMEAKDHCDHTPLAVAVSEGSFAAVRLLLQAGAKTDVKMPWWIGSAETMGIRQLLRQLAVVPPTSATLACQIEDQIRNLVKLNTSRTERDSNVAVKYTRFEKENRVPFDKGRLDLRSFGIDPENTGSPLWNRSDYIS
ncbi:MAG: hypothetical protein GOMPHAMPRED_000985 [Gomphillus americanus]|uniref:Nucleoside phosphorylase domain-containing protein n=1 Tax=Gomphillus americanus TaxID=1940652 RepID=A0A8H3F5K5_9LECA|nr:MAG: hypothetical protein GOMPHAMPRED_000985 [Gomphillus americanus]